MRLDAALEALGLAPSRARARDAILRGTVTVNDTPARKAGQFVSAADRLSVDDPASGYVSRAALKLIAGLDAGEISAVGKVCLDLGASTGGFTQVLLGRGARRVFAVDVGHGQLAPALGARPEVIALEGQNARDLDRRLVPEPIDLLVCDLSFVAVEKVLTAPLALCRPEAEAVILVKPQFELSPGRIGKGGIVSDPAAIAEAEAAVTAFMAERGWRKRCALLSPISGGSGNREIVAVFARGSGRRTAAGEGAFPVCLGPSRPHEN